MSWFFFAALHLHCSLLNVSNSVQGFILTKSKRVLQNKRAAYEIFSLIDCECAAFFSFFSLRLNQQSCIWTAKDNQRYCFNGDCYVFFSRSERTTICFQRDKLCHFNYNWSSVNKKSEICDNFHETNELLLTVCWVCS